MRLTLVGLPGAGVRTVFSALAGITKSARAFGETGKGGRIVVLKVPDPRLKRISQVFRPKKTTPSTVEIVEIPGLFGRQVNSRGLAKAREADSLVLVVRAFRRRSILHLKGSIDPERDRDLLFSELLLADQVMVTGRIDRLRGSLRKRGNPQEIIELELLRRCLEVLDEGHPLSRMHFSADQRKRVRGFGFLTLKPLIVLLNIGEDQLKEELPLPTRWKQDRLQVCGFCAGIEAELGAMAPEDRDEFMAEFGILELAAPKVLRAVYRTLEVVTFYTYSENECRAWTIKAGDSAITAAAKIHTDLADGFIRAEVVSYGDFDRHGDLKAAKAAGRFRLEGRDYQVADGDLVLVRHSG